MSRALHALALGLEGKEYDADYDLKSGPFEYNNKNVKDLVRSAKRRNSELSTVDLAVNELALYIDSLFKRSWKKIRELNIKTYAYEYEFGNAFLYFTEYYQIARLYGANMAVVKETTPRGIDLNAFHYYHHKTKTWQNGDAGEYIIPVGVPYSNIIGLHFGNSYFALYKKRFKGNDYLIYFDLRKIPSQCLTIHQDQFYYCTVTPKKPGRPQLTNKARAQAILRLCVDDLSCDVPKVLKEEVHLEAGEVSDLLLKALTNTPQVKIISQ